MKTIKKIKIRLSVNEENSAVINDLIDKINELTDIINDLNFEISVLHEWKLQKEGI